MSKRADRDLLSDIQEAIRRIEEYIAGMTYQNFLEDTKTQDAVIRNLEIIGEATKNLTKELRERHPNVPMEGYDGSSRSADSPLLRCQFGYCVANCCGRVAQGGFATGRDLKEILREESDV